MRLRGRGTFWLPASSRIIAKSSIGSSSASGSNPYRILEFRASRGSACLVISVLSTVPERVSEMAREICGLLVTGREFGERG